MPDETIKPSAADPRGPSSLRAPEGGPKSDVRASSGGTTKICTTCSTAYDGELCPKCIASFAQQPGDPLLSDRPFGDVIGRYVLEKELGSGGSGVVWLARDPQLGRQVALKILSGASAEDIARFDREAQMAASLQHPNIVPIFEVGRHENRPFIAMQYVSGESLDRLIRDERIGIREAAAVIRDAARAVHHAHTRGIIHRDLKPQNIMVQAASMARKTDVASSISVTGMLLGTPSYMSPEQAKGSAELDARTDVYGLGSTLYTLITRRPPHEGATPLEIVLKAAEGEVLAPREIRRECHRDLETIVMTAMEREKHRRYGTALEMADDLQRYLDGEPIKARPASMVYLLARRFRAHPGRFIGLTMAAVALLLAITLVGIEVRNRRLARELLADAEAHWVAARWSAAAAQYETYESRFGTTPHVAARLAEARRKAAREDGLRKAAQAAVKLGARLDDGVALLAQRRFDPEKTWHLIATTASELEALAQNNPDAPDALHQRGRARRLLHRVAEAKQDIEEALRLDPTHRGARVERIRLAIEQIRVLAFRGRGMNISVVQAHGDAEALLKETGVLPPSAERDIQLIRAMEMFTSEGRRTDALASLVKLADATNDAEVLFWLSVLQRTAGRVAEAEATMRRTLEAHPQHAPTLHQFGTYKASDESFEYFSKSILYDPYEAGAYVNRSIASMNRRDYDAALADLVKAVELAPRMGYGWRSLGNLHVKRDEHDKALEAFQRAIDVDPRDSANFEERAEYLTTRLDWERALPDAEAALALNRCADNHRMRGVILYNLERAKEAIADLEAAVRLDPRSFECWLTLAKMRMKSGNEVGALAAYDRAIEIKGDVAEAWLYRAAMKRTTGDREGALADAERAVALDAKSANAHFQLGESLMALSRFPEAAVAFGDADRLDPTDEEHLCGRARAVHCTGDVEGSMPIFQEVLKRFPDHPCAHVAVGVYWFDRAKYRDALRHLERALPNAGNKTDLVRDYIEKCRERLKE
jgi:tetratricopeptide (TPR) repeat protein